MDRRRKTWKISLQEYCLSNNKEYILQEWDYKKNEELGLSPDNVGQSSNQKVWWVCPRGHSYDMSISDRSKENGQCPYCSGRRLLLGYNDLKSQYLEVVKDWDYEKNDKGPEEYLQHSSHKVHWKCHKCGHEWVAQIAKRTGPQQTGCAKCINHGMSRSEMCLYLTMKKHFPDAQYRIKLFGFEFDIYIPSLNLAIEYDGEYFHRRQRKYNKDCEKDEAAKVNGLRLLRIKETREIDNQFQYANGILFVHTNINVQHKLICEQVLFCLNRHFRINVDVLVDDNITQQAVSQIKSINLHTSLSNVFPDIAKEWHPIKNGDINPQYVAAHAHVDAWWICSKCGEEYQKSIHRRTDIGAHKAGGCPYCSGQKRKVGYNDLETLYPGISKHWLVEKNKELGLFLEDLSPSSTKCAYWIFDNQEQYIQIKSAVNKYKKNISVNFIEQNNNDCDTKLKSKEEYC